MNRLTISQILATSSLLAFSSLLSARPVQAGDAASWVPASPRRSCSEICAQRQLSAVTSGRDRHGYAFHVCRGVASNGERRPGFNIETSADSAGLCLFEMGGGREQAANYDCLCLSDGTCSEPSIWEVILP